MFRLIFLFIGVFSLFSCSNDDDREQDPVEQNQNFKVYFVQHYSMDAFGYSYAYFQDYMLLDDGTILYDTEQPYEEVKVDQFRQKQPKKVGTWEKKGNTIVVRFGEKESVWETWYEGFPANKGEKLEGSYKSLRSTTIRKAQHYAFQTDGTYTFTDSSKNIVQQGSYELKGYGMYLTPENGTTQGYSFIFMPKNGKKDSKGLMVNGDNWVKE